MSALQLWLQNHNRKLTQDAIDEALMEYIAHVEKQRDELLKALEEGRRLIELISPFEGDVTRQIDKAIASVKEK